MPNFLQRLKSAMPVSKPIFTTKSRQSYRRFQVIGGFTILLIGAIPAVNAEPDATNSSADTQTTKRAAARPVGETTTSLLAAQAEGSIAGPGLPMLGATGNLSWQRYLDSFKYRIPENFTNRINKSSDQ